MTDYYGQATTIEQAPFPSAAVNIASSTNAAPTVITTSAAHGLHTGQIAIIYGHLVNTNANGIYAVTVVSSTTFKISTLSTFPGTFVAGNGVGVATGTVQSLAFPGVALPEDAVTDIDAAAFNVPYEALLDMTADLAYRLLSNIRVYQGGSLTLLTNSSMLAQTGTTITSTGTVSLEADGLFVPTLQMTAGTRSWPAPQRFGDADNTISASSGQQVILTQAPTTGRVLTLTAPTRDGLPFEFNLHLTGAVGATDYYEIKRAASAQYIARLSGWSTDLATDLGTGVCKLVSEGGVWRLAGGVGILLGADA